jgi:hypothetical protein
MQDYKIIRAFTENQKNLLKRRLNSYKSNSKYTLSRIETDLNSTYWKTPAIKVYVDNAKTKNATSKTWTLKNGEFIVSRDQLQKILGNINHETGDKKSNFPRDPELNVIAQYLYNNKYISNAQLNFLENIEYGAAYTLSECFNTELNNELIGLQGDYIRYEIDEITIKQQVLNLTLSEANHFFIVTCITSLFDNYEKLKNHESFKLNNYKNRCDSIKIQTGWISPTSKNALIFFQKDWCKYNNYNCSLLTEYYKNDKINSIRLQSTAFVFNGFNETAPSRRSEEYKVCNKEEFDQVGASINNDYSNLKDKSAEFYQDSKRSAPTAKVIEQGENQSTIKKPQSYISLVVNNHDNHSKEVKVMRNELGEKFVQAINERDQKTYLECFKQRVDVN